MPAFLSLSCVQDSDYTDGSLVLGGEICFGRKSSPSRGSVLGTLKQCGQVKGWRKDRRDTVVSWIPPRLGMEAWLGW